MAGHKFDPKNLAKLDNPSRLRRESPHLILDLAETPHPRVIVDLGAGSGFYALPLATRLAPGGRVLACDTSAEMCDVLRSRVPDGLPVEVVHTDEVAVPLPDAEADLVLMANVYHELDDPRGSLDEARRLLADGGTLVIVDWKAEPTPEGPPVDHRIPAPVIVGALLEAGYLDVTVHDALPQHAVITATKRPSTAIHPALGRLLPALMDYLTSFLASEPTLAGAEPAALLAFGSRARGDARPDSDLDLLLALDGVSPSSAAAFPVEHRGILQGPDGPVDLQMPIHTRHTLEQGVADGRPILTTVLASALPLRDTTSWCSTVLAQARGYVAAKRRAFMAAGPQAVTPDATNDEGPR